MMSNESQLTILMVEDDDVDAKGMARSFKKRRIANPIVRANDA